MDGTLAEIRMFAGNFAPRGWQLCNGQLLSIAQWTAVFALVGTTYGGDGQTTFGVPDFRGRIAMGAQFSQGPGLSAIQLGEMSGTPSVTLLSTNIPAHNHTISGTVNIQAAGDGALGSDPANRYIGPGNFYAGAAELQSMAPAQLALNTTSVGGGQPFNKLPPYLGMNYIFCVEGIFPSRD
jgi:microcystin-dependent protein